MPRAYPRGYALKMLEGYETHLQNCGEGRRDLRFKPQVEGNLSELEQFKKLPIGDPWEDAQMMELLEYLMTSKRVRTDFLHEEFLWNLTMLLGHISCFWHWQQLGFQKNGARSWTRSMMTIVALFLCLTNSQFRPDVTKAIFSGLWGDGLKGSSIVANSLKISLILRWSKGLFWRVSFIWVSNAINKPQTRYDLQPFLGNPDHRFSEGVGFHTPESTACSQRLSGSEPWK